MPAPANPARKYRRWRVKAQAEFREAPRRERPSQNETAIIPVRFAVVTGGDCSRQQTVWLPHRCDSLRAGCGKSGRSLPPRRGTLIAGCSRAAVALRSALDSESSTDPIQAQGGRCFQKANWRLIPGCDACSEPLRANALRADRQAVMPAMIRLGNATAQPGDPCKPADAALGFSDGPPGSSSLPVRASRGLPSCLEGTTNGAD